MSAHNRHTRLLSFSLAVAAALVVATSVSAAGPKWSAPELLRAHRFVHVEDAAFSGENVAIVWAEQPLASSMSGSIRVRSSDTGGSSFAPARVFPDSFQGRVAICGGEVYVVYSKRAGEDRVIELAHGAAGSGLPDVTTVAGGAGERLNPDVACTESRVFVSWNEREGDQYRLYVSSALADDVAFDPPMNVGLVDVTNSLLERSAIAASGNMAYAFYGLGDGKLRLSRWTIGAGPDALLTSLGSSIVVAGRVGRFAEHPVIEAQADTVAIAWSRCSGTYARVSHNLGATWDMTRPIVHFGCGGVVEDGTTPLMLALSGNRMLLSYSATAVPGYQASKLVRTSDDFVGQLESLLGAYQAHFVGFISIARHERLGDAFNTNNEVKFRLQQ